MDAYARVMKLTALLLQYPDRRLFDLLPAIDAALESMPPGRCRQGLQTFRAYLQDQPLLRVQEHYTAIFDLNPSTCLNTTYHRWGDGEKRADAMVRLQQIYMDAGYDIGNGELPDFLPLILEFLSVCPESGSNELIRQCLECLPHLIDRLHDVAPAYAALLQIVDGRGENGTADMVSGSPPGDDAVMIGSRNRPES